MDQNTQEVGIKPAGRVLSFEHCAVAASARTVARTQTQTCIDIRFIKKEHPVVIDCNLAVTDNDDTLLLHTGEHIHDGHKARFALGLSDLLVRYHLESGNPFLNSEHLKIYEDTGSIFTRESWDRYRQQTGKSEDAVINGILELALERFDLTNHRKHITKDHYQLAVSKVLEKKFAAFMQHVKTDQGLKKLFQEMVNQKVPLGVCSASSAAFVKNALKLAEVDHLVTAYVCSAVKKSGDGEYIGEDLRSTCERLGGRASQAVMFGDTMNDIGAAVLAGVPVIIIRVPGGVAGCDGANAALVGQMHQQILNQVDSFGNQESYQRTVLEHGYTIRPTVLLVDDFSQVVFGSKISETKLATFNEIATHQSST